MKKERCALVDGTPASRALVERYQLSTRNYRLLLLVIALAAVIHTAPAQDKIPLVEIKSVDPSIVVELRYAGSNNLAGRPLYQPNTPALIRPEVARRLAAAQTILKRYGYCLKIWDAYRPNSVQVELWKAAAKNDYVANPTAGAGSLHSWGVAVDATLTDFYNRPVSMPTDYDNFTPAAMWKYQGTDPAVRAHLYLLQSTMRDAGFLGIRTEWWHFTVRGWQKFLPPEEAKRAMEGFGTKWEGQL
ncbi:MAG: M15 family metallopeptidase [Verrucomicrobiota bacterium]